MHFTIKDGRDLKELQKVQVYKNLHKDCYSIRDSKTKLVIAYGTRFALWDPKFKVSEAGRQRVLSTGQKNVHAYIEGNIVFGRSIGFDLKQLYYDPFKVESFVDKECDIPIDEALLVEFSPEGVFYCD